MDQLTQIVEAIVFAAGRLVAGDEIREAVRAVTGHEELSDEEISDAVHSLNARYDETGSAVRIHEWADGLRMATIPDVANYLHAFFKEGPRKLTRSLMETLSVVAYRQPVSKPEIDNVRGVDSNYALRRLMEIGLISMAGRSDTVGRPLVFTTTTRFLEEFGMRSLDELPQLREAEELFADGEWGSVDMIGATDQNEDVEEDTEAPDEENETKA